MDTVNADSAPSPQRRLSLSNLQQRLLSALVLVPVLFALNWLGSWWVAGTVLLIVLLALRELYSMFAVGGYRPHAAGYVVAVALVAVAVVRTRWNLDLAGFMLALALILTLAAELPRRDHAGSLLNWTLTFAGATYVAWLLAHIVLLRGYLRPLAPAPLAAIFPDSGAAWIVWVLVIAFSSDSGAYFVGRSLGRHPMAPRISPKKSWEGAVGGLLAATLGSWLAVVTFGLPLHPVVAAFLGALGSAAGQAGDLAESLIKRQVGVKDSGALIPGHGGMLDRVDSLLFTIPSLYYCLIWLTP